MESKLNDGLHCCNMEGEKRNLGHAVDPVLQSRQGSAGAILLLMQRCALTGRAVRASGGSRARV